MLKTYPLTYVIKLRSVPENLLFRQFLEFINQIDTSMQEGHN